MLIIFSGASRLPVSVILHANLMMAAQRYIRGGIRNQAFKSKLFTFGTNILCEYI